MTTILPEDQSGDGNRPERARRPRRVLWLTKGLGLGGAERLMVDAVPHLDLDRFRIEVAYLLPWKNALVPALEGHDIRVHCLDAGREFDLRWLRRLRRLVRSGDFDLIHTHMPYPAIGARLALSHPPLVHTEHNLWKRYRQPTRCANAVTFGRNRRVIAVSESVASSIHPLRWLGAPSVEVIVHGIDVTAVCQGSEARAHARATLGLAPGEHVIGTVGNFTAKKDHATLLSAFRLIRAEYPDARLVLVGSGPLESELRAAADRLGIAERVSFVGSRTDVPHLLPAFDVFALSSRYEGLPIALLEALASGIPCVATTAGGIPEVVKDGREGFLVEPGDATGLARQLGRLLGDAALRHNLGQAAAARGSQFGIGPAMQRIQDLYDEVCDSR